MMRQFLFEMLEMLTGAYNRRDVVNTQKGRPVETNIGRLFSSFSWGLEEIEHQSAKVLEWDDIDKAKGSVLDRYGKNFGVARNGANDVFYRLLIKIKMISLLSGGDINTVINAASSLFDVDPALIDLQEVFPAKIWMYLDKTDLTPEQVAIADLIATVIKRIIAAGVGFRLFLREYYSASGNIVISNGIVSYLEIKSRPISIDKIVSAPMYINAGVLREISTTANPIQ